MAKTTRSKTKPLNGCKGTPNVASSYKSSSSDEEVDESWQVKENCVDQSTSCTSKTRLLSLRSAEAKSGSFLMAQGRNSTNANVNDAVTKCKRKSTQGKNTNLLPSHEDVNDFSQSHDPKWEDYEIVYRKGARCFSRNAIMARMNRIKKKRYLESLEMDYSKLTEENKTLKKSLTDQEGAVIVLKKRVKYLESVLTNSREIGMLLKVVEKSTGLPTINSLESSKSTKHLSFKPSCSPIGFPPPQRDHMYSKTPDVEIDGNDLPTISDNLGTNMLSTEDFNLGSMEYEDDTLPFLPSNDAPDYLYTAESCGTFDADFSDLSQYFNEVQDHKLLSDVGICLHIAEKRVSLEFCDVCNSNSANAWNAQSSIENELSPE